MEYNRRQIGHHHERECTMSIAVFTTLSVGLVLCAYLFETHRYNQHNTNQQVPAVTQRIHWGASINIMSASAVAATTFRNLSCPTALNKRDGIYFTGLSMHWKCVRWPCS